MEALALVLAVVSVGLMVSAALWRIASALERIERAYRAEVQQKYVTAPFRTGTVTPGFGMDPSVRLAEAIAKMRDAHVATVRSLNTEHTCDICAARVPR